MYWLIRAPKTRPAATKAEWLEPQAAVSMPLSASSLKGAQALKHSFVRI